MSKYSKHVTDVSKVRKFVERAVSALSLVHEHSASTNTKRNLVIEFSCILVPTTT